MTRMIGIGVGAAIVGVLTGFLWWGTAANRLRDEVRALQNQQADADAAVKGMQSKLKKTEEELQSERERRARLELVISQGRK
jgi:predicted  nucleic acid-binding Zn-ribbon protein